MNKFNKEVRRDFLVRSFIPWMFFVTFLIIAFGGSGIAVDTPLPSEAQHVLDDLDKSIDKLKDKAANDLQKLRDQIGTLGASACREKENR